MPKTVIGFFDHADEAQHTADILVRNGFERGQVELTRNQQKSSALYEKTRGEADNGFGRFFKSLFGNNEKERERYIRAGQNSNYMIAVHAQSDAEAEKAADLLDECGALDLDGRSYSGRSSSASSGPGASASQQPLASGSASAEERSRSRIVERPVEERVQLSEEHVYVERRKVDRLLDVAESPAFKDLDIELTERSEVPVVRKEARVVEEVTVGKEVEDYTATVRGSVRDTETGRP